MTSFQFPENETHLPNREELLQMAVRAAQQGNRDGARVMLRKVLSEDARNERAMMWMAKLAGTRAERKEWLNRVLQVNPDNDTARDALHRMEYKRSAHENRTLLIYGVVAAVMIVLGLAVVLLLVMGR